MKSFSIYSVLILTLGYIHFNNKNGFTKNNSTVNSSVYFSSSPFGDTLSQKVDLSNHQLNRIPEELKKFKNINSLNLSNNPNLSLIESIETLLDFDQLKTLQLEGCRLSFIPYKLGNLKTITFLNLSNNHITEIPNDLSHLVNLQHIDLSNNNLTLLKYAPSLWDNLKSINLKNNPNLDHTEAFYVLSFIKNKLNKIEVSDIDTIPFNVSTIKCNEVVFENSLLTNFEQVANNKSIHSITLNNCDEENVIKGLKEAKFDTTLTELTINNSISTFPSSVSIPGLKALNLANNNINQLSLKSSKLPKLENLDITNCTLSDDNITEIKKEFPNITINDGKTKAKTESVNKLQPLSEKLVDKPQKKLIDPTKKQEVTFSSVSLNIPKNSIVDKNGNPITEPISIAVTEYNNPAETILAGIPMNYDSAGVSYNFESAGMMNISATTQNGEEVFIAKNSPITVNVLSNQKDDNYNLYQLDTSNGQWNYLNNSIETNSLASKDTIDYSTMEDYIFNYIKAPNFPRMPNIGRSNYLININRIKKNDKMEAPILIDAAPSSSQFNLSYKNTILFLNDNLRYDGNYNNFKKGIRKFYNYRNDEYKLIQTYFANNNIQVDSTFNYKTPWSFELKIDHDQDNFDLMIDYPDSAMHIPVDLRMRSNPEQDQKTYKKFWKKYLKARKKDENVNLRTIKNYYKALDKYEAEMEKLQQKLREKYPNFEENYLNQVSVERSFNIYGFGLFNCDRYRNIERVNALVKVKNLKKEVILPVIIFIINKASNGFSKHFGEGVFFGKKEKNSMAIITADNQIGVISVNEFEFAYANMTRGKLEFETSFFPIDSLNRTDLIAKIMGS